MFEVGPDEIVTAAWAVAALNAEAVAKSTRPVFFIVSSAIAEMMPQRPLPKR